jgi:DNA mismatch repair protein MutS2
MGFDEKTLQPTYVLQLGAPGKSAGLEIASRLGLSEDLITRARQRMSTSERDIAMFLNELHQRLRRTAVEEQDLREQRQALEAREHTLTSEFEQREKIKFQELDERLRSALTEFEAQTQESIQKVLSGAEQRKAAEQAERRLARERREFEEKARVAVFGAAPVPQQRFIPIEEGDRIRLKGVREPARVRRKLSGGMLEVEAGLMRMKITTDDVEEVLPAAPETTRLPKNVSYEAGPRWDVTYREINVIGKRAEEAREEVDKFLDSAAMASVDRVRVVHGHGMGILKKVIGELLATNPHVEKYYPATPAEGGTGATVVELK